MSFLVFRITVNAQKYWKIIVVVANNNRKDSTIKKKFTIQAKETWQNGDFYLPIISPYRVHRKSINHTYCLGVSFLWINILWWYIAIWWPNTTQKMTRRRVEQKNEKPNEITRKMANNCIFLCHFRKFTISQYGYAIASFAITFVSCCSCTWWHSNTIYTLNDEQRLPHTHTHTATNVYTPNDVEINVLSIVKRAQKN